MKVGTWLNRQLHSTFTFWLNQHNSPSLAALNVLFYKWSVKDPKCIPSRPESFHAKMVHQWWAVSCGEESNPFSMKTILHQKRCDNSNKSNYWFILALQQCMTKGKPWQILKQIWSKGKFRTHQLTESAVASTQQNEKNFRPISIQLAWKIVKCHWYPCN